MDIEDLEGMDAVECAVPAMGEEEIAPHLQDFSTVGHLYPGVRRSSRSSVDTNVDIY
jgi:hypothetical protein